MPADPDLDLGSTVPATEEEEVFADEDPPSLAGACLGIVHTGSATRIFCSFTRISTSNIQDNEYLLTEV